MVSPSGVLDPFITCHLIQTTSYKPITKEPWNFRPSIVGVWCVHWGVEEVLSGAGPWTTKATLYTEAARGQRLTSSNNLILPDNQARGKSSPILSIALSCKSLTHLSTIRNASFNRSIFGAQLLSEQGSACIFFFLYTGLQIFLFFSS